MGNNIHHQPQMTLLLLRSEGGPIGKTENRNVVTWEMHTGYASSLSAFSDGHPQWSSTASVTTTLQASRTGIPNAGLARAIPPVVIKRGLEMSLRD